MQLETILNYVEKYKSFVYADTRLVKSPQQPGVAEAPPARVEVKISARANGHVLCSGCLKSAPGYDRLPERQFEYVPLWGIPVFFLYAMRRVDCPNCGIKVEEVPWCRGKHAQTKTYQWFLANWARRLSWQETARVFHTSWQTVFRAVRHAVYWGIMHDVWRDVRTLGVDEIAWQKGHSYLTLVYQLDEGEKRLLWIGRGHDQATLERFFNCLGREASAELDFVCSDMLKAYVKAIATSAGNAVHVLDRFHVMQLLHKAIDEVRREEVQQLKEDGFEPILTHSRWCLLKRKENYTEKETLKLKELMQYNLKSVKASLQKDDFQRFWQYRSATWAGKFLDDWCKRVNRTNLEPIKKVARTLQKHRELLLNWFRAEGRLSSGAVEGFNNKAKLTMRKAYGYKSLEVCEIALFHTLSKLPEPEFTHKFW